MESWKDDPDNFNRDLINNIPYASSLISFGSSSESLIILQSTNRNHNYWVSADNIIFKEKNGRLIGTIGLPNDLRDVERPDFSFEEIINQGKTEHYSYYSFKKPTLNNLKVHSSFKIIGPEQISILERDFNLILVEEDLFSDQVNWDAKNRYWVDPESYFVWMSEQHISPKLPVIKLQITKRPSR